MVCYPSLPPWLSTTPGTGFVPAPFGIGGLWTFQPTPMAVTLPYVQPKASPTVPPQPVKKEPSKNKAKKNAWAPPNIDAKNGMSYMFDKAENHTVLHVFNKAAAIWTEKYEKENLKFRQFKVSTNFTFKMVIENTLKKSEDDCKGWAVTEVTERRRGRWHKGTTIEYTSDRASQTLKTMGWTSKRGSGLPPVWIVVHKVDVK